MLGTRVEETDDAFLPTDRPVHEGVHGTAASFGDDDAETMASEAVAQTLTGSQCVRRKLIVYVGSCEHNAMFTMSPFTDRREQITQCFNGLLW